MNTSIVNFVECIHTTYCVNAYIYIDQDTTINPLLKQNGKSNNNKKYKTQNINYLSI